MQLRVTLALAVCCLIVATVRSAIEAPPGAAAADDLAAAASAEGPSNVAAAPVQGGAIELRKSFFQNLLNGFAGELERTVKELDFPTVGTSSCSDVLINAGKWFDSVSVPNASAAVAGVHGAPTSISLSASGVSVKGLGGSKSWSSLQESSVSGAWSTCFQLCFGASPFTITTGLSSKPKFNIARGKTTSVSVDDVDLGFSSGWKLSPVTGMCVSNQDTFDATFRKGVSPTLSKAVPTMSKVVADAFNSVMSNSSASGFDGLVVDPATGMVTLSNGPLPPTIPIPMPGGNPKIDGSAVKATVTLDATQLPGMTTASCVQQKPCGLPTGHGTTKMQYTECGACLVAVKDKVYFAFESDAGFAQPASAPLRHRHAITFPEHPVPKTPKRRHHRPRCPERKLRHMGAQQAAAALGVTNAIESRTYNTLALMSKAMTTAGSAAASLLEGVTVTPAHNTKLDGAGEYCHVTHGGFSWSIPDALEINAVAINTTAVGQAASIVVEIPALGSIGGSGDFSTWCIVGLPLGTPFRDAAAGSFKVSMAPPSGVFRVTVSVTPEGDVSVVNYPELTFAASVDYNDHQRAFSFAPYLENLFVGTVKDAAVAATREVLRTKVTDLWTGKLSGLFKTSAAAATIGTAPTSMGPAVTMTTKSVEPAETEITLDALVPVSSMGDFAATANGGILATVAPAAPFVVDNCARRVVCSAAPAGSAAPLSEPLSLRNCTSCVTTKQGHLVLGTKFAVSFDAAPHRGAVVAQQQMGDAEAAKPSLRMKKTRTGRRLRKAEQLRTGDAPTTVGVDSIFYAGKDILTQASAAAGPTVRQAFAGYSHAPQTDLGLLYVQQFCNVSHPAIAWSGVPAKITPTVTNIAPAADSAVEMTVVLDGLPSTLTSESVAFSTRCAIGTEWPTVFAESQEGHATAKLAFDTNSTNGAVTLQIRAEVMTNPHTGPLVDIVVLGMTGFAVSGAYGYNNPVDGFTLDAYVKNYFETQLPQLMLAELNGVMQEQVWFALDRYLGDLVTDTMRVSVGCNVSSFENTHLVVARGPNCGGAIPAPASAIGSGNFLYLVDAGPAPAIASNHSATQQLHNCTSAMQLGAPLSATVQLTECATSSAIVDGRVVLSVHGTEPVA